MNHHYAKPIHINSTLCPSHRQDTEISFEPDKNNNNNNNNNNNDNNNNNNTRIENSVPVKPPAVKIYISHCSSEPREIEEMLTLATHMRTSNIEVVVDIFNKVHINTHGGLSRWIPAAMESARKILVLVTPKYLNALENNRSSDNENISKVHAEFNYLGSIVHTSLQKTSKILVVCKGVGREQLPTVFSGMTLCTWGGGSQEKQMRNIARHLVNS